MEANNDTDPLISMEILLDKLSAIESRMEDNFSNLHTQISELTCEFKHEINVVKSTLNELQTGVPNETAPQKSRSAGCYRAGWLKKNFKSELAGL